jgi:hypothetical protein
MQKLQNQPPQNQKALAVIPYAGLRKNAFHSVSCNVVLFPQEIVHATFTKRLLQQEMKRKKEEYEKEKGAPIRVGSIRMGVTLYYYAKYFDMNPAEIVEEHKDNFTISVDDIQSISYLFDANELLDPPPQKIRPGKLHIVTSYGQWNYTFSSIPATELLSALQEIGNDITIDDGKASWNKL